MDLSDILEDLGKPIYHYPEIARAVGGQAGLFLSSLSLCEPDEDGWVSKSTKEIKNDTGLTKWQQMTVRKKLKKLGVLEEKPGGGSVKLQFRVRLGRLQQLVKNRL